uniref:Uncharacterized protein n=1 Tax=Aegilops tauschii subsp. strangulata TaxID=200361 RepID=A0A453NH36_AEGTS
MDADRRIGTAASVMAFASCGGWLRRPMAFPASPEMGHVNVVTSVDTVEEEEVTVLKKNFSVMVGSIRRPQLTFQAPPPRPAGQRQRKKMRLPEVQQLVRSLAVENESLHEVMIRFTYLSKYLRISSKLATARLLTKALEFFLDFEQEMRELQRACSELSKENDKLETRIVEQSNSRNEATLKEQKGKQQQLDQQQQSPHDSFALPDLNLPAQDGADGSVPC